MLVGKEYWSGLADWLEQKVYEEFDTIDKEDLRIFQVVDSAEEAFAIVSKSKERTFF